LFIQKIEKGGILIYNAADSVLNDLVLSNKRADIRYQPYEIPAHTILNGLTTVTIEAVTGSIQVFGNHNLLNMQAAFFACKELGVSASDFLKAISNFTGASKRLELMASNENTRVYRDFAHAPSKVKATMEAVHQQYPSRKLIAILELHTFSSLNEAFMQEYKGALELADEAVVFYSKHALALKRMPDLPADTVIAGFQKKGLQVINSKEALWNWLQMQSYTNANLLLMSSGNYDGLDMLTFAQQITKH
jgi:UDP-N-acetylmuramate: L-alanyl-gamma-D-glutamyl-meso-diaminopimelate ligase